MLLLDATHTSHTRAQTGIQRVTRSLFAELAREGNVTGICYDPYLNSWRPLEARELDHLRPDQKAAGSRGAKWPLHQRLAGHARRLLGARIDLPAATGLICPELFTARTGAHWPEIFPHVHGPRVALFNDAIGLQYPELTPPATVARLPAYLRELLQFDGVAAISEASAVSLRDYWRWLGVTDPPPVMGLPLAADPPAPSAGDHPPAVKIPRVLSVGTIEGRKNHLALVEACELLWTEGMEFELNLIGIARADTAGRALSRIHALQQAGRPLLYHGAAGEAELQAAYQQCAFTVYPSLLEGFGLPVLESLQHGKPCVCSAHGAVGESATGGGCVVLDSVDMASLAAALRRLLKNPAELVALTAAVRARRFKSWAEYARELTTWMSTLPRPA
ncbi:MAG: glycosyltransferase family 1 protein [Lacunisphaera sp.]|nr:glycosyltransferase family 1 protein [Lacunisphaera sp.]